MDALNSLVTALFWIFVRKRGSWAYVSSFWRQLHQLFDGSVLVGSFSVFAIILQFLFDCPPKWIIIDFYLFLPMIKYTFNCFTVVSAHLSFDSWLRLRLIEWHNIPLLIELPFLTLSVHSLMIFALLEGHDTRAIGLCFDFYFRIIAMIKFLVGFWLVFDYLFDIFWFGAVCVPTRYHIIKISFHNSNAFMQQYL